VLDFEFNGAITNNPLPLWLKNETNKEAQLRHIKAKLAPQSLNNWTLHIKDKNFIE